MWVEIMWMATRVRNTQRIPFCHFCRAANEFRLSACDFFFAIIICGWFGFCTTMSYEFIAIPQQSMVNRTKLGKMLSTCYSLFAIFAIFCFQFSSLQPFHISKWMDCVKWRKVSVMMQIKIISGLSVLYVNEFWSSSNCI